MKNSILSAHGIVAGYRDREVLHTVSIESFPDETILLIGPNGCGKTTLLKVLAGALRPKQGKIFFKGADVSKVFEHTRARMGIGYLMQTRNLFPSLTVEENLRLSFWNRGGSYEHQRESVLNVFPILKPMLDHRAGILSGGQRQALAIGIVLMRDVDVLILDEPTAGLAPRAALTILEAIHNVQTTSSFSIIIVEHNLRLVYNWVSRVLIMKQGRIIAEERDPSVLADYQRLQDYYFG